jgi:hypothetical protein
MIKWGCSEVQIHFMRMNRWLVRGWWNWVSNAPAPKARQCADTNQGIWPVILDLKTKETGRRTQECKGEGDQKMLCEWLHRRWSEAPLVGISWSKVTQVRCWDPLVIYNPEVGPYYEMWHELKSLSVPPALYSTFHVPKTVSGQITCLDIFNDVSFCARIVMWKGTDCWHASNRRSKLERGR